MQKILFIGNSYTYFNKMPEIFESIARSCGKEVEISAITKGGYTLEKHANPEEEITGVRVAEALSSNNKGAFDAVVLQEQSVRPAKDPEKFYEAAKLLIEKIKNIGAVPYLYATWGRKDGCPLLEEMGWNNEIMTDMLAATYGKIGEETNTCVAFVGRAFRDIYTNYPDLTDLYNPDKSHPSYSGSFLAALVLAAKILGIDPLCVEFCGELDENVAKVLKESAHRFACV